MGANHKLWVQEEDDRVSAFYRMFGRHWGCRQISLSALTDFTQYDSIIAVRSSNVLWFSFLFPVNPVNILSINLLGRRLSLCITMGCTALFFLLLNICTSRYSGSDCGSSSRVYNGEGRTLVFSGHQSVRPVILVGLRKASDWLSFSWESCGSDSVVQWCV